MRIEAVPCPSSDNVPAMFSALIHRIQTASSSTAFIEELDRARCQQSIMSKTELGRWAGVLDRCDEILENATVIEHGKMSVDHNAEVKKNVVSILKFTALLFECTSTRRIYASMDRLLNLLDSSDLTIVADVLRLLQTIGKRSKYLPTRLSPQEQTLLVDKLTAIAQCWGGKLRNMKMVDTLNEETPVPNVFPFQYSDGKGHDISLDSMDEREPLLAVVDRITTGMDPLHRYVVVARLRMIRNIHLPDHRMHCLIIRLLSISTLIYCRCHPDENQINALVFPGFVDETAALLKVPLTKHYLVDQIQAESLRTLTAIVSLDKSQKVNEILDGLGANSYHGFIANFTRMLVAEIKTGSLGKPGKPSIPLATALFSFIYHVSNNDTGGEKLLSCGLTQTLLSVIEHKELCLDLLSFATRCCRIIDTFTTMDVASFRTMKGMNIFLDRIVHEVNECRKDQPFVIDTSEDTEDNQGKYIVEKTPVVDKRCHQLRVGLIKGLLTFVKRVISVPELQESVRHIMEGNFPEALIHIISNAEYYSDSVYHHTLQLVTNFIYQEPAQLTQLQGKHLPYVMLQSMLRKELPNSRDVIGSLGNVFTALCLNEAGLKQFMSYKPFEHIFKILLSIKFLATIKKKRAEMSDSASNIGVSLDDLLRHHPVLKASMLTATITALDILNKCATDSSTNTKIVMAISKIASRSAGLNNGGASGSNSPAVERTVDEVDQFEDGFSPRDDESDDDDEADLSMDEVSTVGKVPEDKMGLEMDCPSDAQDGSRIIPLGDYIIIFAKVFEQIISQSSTNSTEIIEGFVQQGGIEKLLELSQIQPIASELSASSYTNSIANILQNLLSFKPAGNRMMEAFIEVFSKRASPLLLSNDDDQINGSYLLPLGTDVISEATACIGTLTPILSNLTRLNAGPSQYTIERKGRVHEAWLTPTGKAFHQNLRRASRHLSWESTLIKLTENTRVSEGTQTDPVPFEKKKEGEAQKEETCVDSVAVEPSVKPIEKSPWEDAGIPQSVVDAWRREKNVADCVVKANKQILEFFNSLARSCYSPLRRNRRYEFNSYSQPKPSAQLAEDVFASIYQELKFSPKDKGNSPMEFGRISDTLAQLNLVLFDERRHGFHPMLDKFYSTGLHKAFCDVLAEKLAPALEGHVSAQLDGAFGDWFRLAGRLANRQKIVGTVYKQYGTNAFDPEKYTRLVQSDFFRVLSELFTKLSLPTVNLHNYQGLCEEAISVFKEVARSFVPSKFEATEPPRPQPREEQIQNLMEMGFEREEIMLAFHRAPSFEEATDYLISRQQQSLPLQPQQQQEAEDDSAVPFLPLAQREDDGRLSAGSEDIVSAALEGAAAPIIVPLKELKIDKDISISQACIELMPLCKRLMELGSELVFSCADLFISVEPTLDADWKINELLKNIMAQEVSIMATNVIQQSQEGVPEQTEVITLATRLHFCCLLFEHVAKEYLKVMSEYKLPSLLHHLLDVIEKHFDLTFMHDKLLPPAVLWLDLYDKFARLFERRDLLLEAFGNSQTKTLKWTWLGDDEIGRYRSNKKWVSYNTPTQEILTAAFFEGKSKVLIKKGDKETVVDFGLMLERENQSPRIMVNAELPDDKELVVNMARVLQSERKSMWTEEEITGLVKNLTRILGKGVLFTRASWSILSFLARLTRDKNCADLFIKQNGVCSLIRLRSSCTPCSTALISLILRQCIDTDDLLRSIFEKSVRQVTIVTPQMEFLGMPDSKPKEWYETLNKLMPLAVRQPDVFADVMSKSVTMKQSTSGNNELLLMQHVSKSNKPSTDINENMTTVVSLLLTEVLIGEWIDDKNIPLGYSRMLSRSSILNILSELIKTYQCAAPLVTDAKHENQKILLSLLEKYIAHEDKETLRSLKILIAVLASCNHSPKAQESLVSDIKTCIVTICETSTNDVTVLHTKLTELCSLISAMAENPGTQSSRSPSSLNTANPIMKLFHKKKVCNDLVKTITLLRFNHKEAIDTVSEILRTMEVLMRHINNPTANATVEDLVGQGRARADRGMFSFEEIFQSHLNEEERRRFEELDRRIFHPADGINRGLDQLREHVEAIERNFDAAFQNRGNVDDRPVEEAAEEDSADERPHDNEIRDENESSEEEPESGEEDEEGVEHDGGDLDMSQDSVEGEEPDATMEQEHQDERHDEGDTEEEEEEDEEQDDDDEDDDGDEDDDPYEQGFAGDRDRFEDIYDFGIDSMDSIMDDWDVFPHAYLNHYNRIRNRGRRPQNDAHPLLVRPHHLTDNQSAAVNTGHPYDYPNVVLGIQHVGHPGAQLALTRQNAIRRIGGTSRARPLEPRRMFFDRLFDVRDGHGLMTTGIAPREIDDQRLRATVPSALERIVEGSDLLESLSVRYIGILINTCVTKAAKDQLAAEKAAKEKADEEKKKKENEAKMAAKVLTDAANEASAATSSTANETSQTAVVVAPPSSEVAQAWNGEEGPVTRNPSQEEPMDMTDTHEHEGAPDAFLSSSETTMASSIQGEEHRPESPVQMDESTVPSDTPMDTDPEVVTSNEQVATQQPPSGSAVPPSTSQDIPEEFRAILGDIVVPEGVDVAFLAALPDDMRAEVLRDHERQQRAQRAVTAPLQPPAGQNAPVPVPVVEPLDQEFLSALPPDLQEEILQQHERAVREAEEAIRRANEPVAPAQPEMDGAAVIASLPPRERQQVLAEMDDAELQRLPQAMQDEARRARVHMQNVFEPIQRNVMRIHNLYVRQGRGPLRGTTGNGTGSVGVAAGRTYTANSQAMQLLDKESIIILCGLFLVDHRINSTRLQKVIRLICSHAPSCEFVIWCLQGFLDKASEGSNFDADDIISTGPGWLDSIGVPGLGLGERCAKISKNVYVNPLISPSICRNVVDTLITLARCYPGHFLPTVLRNEQIECKNWPERSSFWQLLQNPSGKAIGKEPVDTRPPADQFSSCPFTHFFYYFNKKLFQDTANLQDKLFRVINTIAQTLPDNVIHRLGLSPTATPSEKEIKILIGVLSRGICGPDGFADGRSILMELMRVLSPSISDIIYDDLSDTITSIGLKLQPQIEQLMVEMNSITKGPDDEEPSSSEAVTEKGRVISARLAGESVVVDGDSFGKLKMTAYACAELRLPAMNALTDKHGAQYSLLSSLQTLTKLRDTMRSRKQKKIDDEKRKTEASTAAQEQAPVAADVQSAAPVNLEAQIDVRAPSNVALPGAAQEMKEAVNLDLISVELPTSRLSKRLSSLEDLWKVVSAALLRLGKASDPHAVLALQPAAEAFFLVHAVPKSSATDNEHPDNKKMIEFAEMHREVLNQVLRQNSQALSPGGPFAFLTQFPKLLDFDVKRKYFRKELTKMDNDREYRRADINVQVRRQHLFSDSFRELYRLRPSEWKKRFYIVFQGEEGQDAGGLLREWFSVITREIFNPNYALFITAPGDMVTYMINKASYINPEHLDYFKFVGKLIAKAIYDNKLLDCYFTRAFYKHILNVPVRYQDIESEDPAFFKSLEFLLNNPINDLGLDLTFSLEVEEFGVRSIRDLKENGRKIEVTDENKVEYVNLVCQMKMTGSIQRQLDSFLSGFYEIIPKSLISMFNEQELELLISGLPDVDIDDLANNTEYKSYAKTSPQIQWFWRALRSFEPEDRAKFLQFVTGTSKVPLQGFATLEGMNGVQKFSIHMDSRGGDRLPAAHTCFNQLDLPQYESYEKLRDALLTAIRECTTGFGFA